VTRKNDACGMLIQLRRSRIKKFKLEHENLVEIGVFCTQEHAQAAELLLIPQEPSKKSSISVIMAVPSGRHSYDRRN
jgi:hypothetical protein